MSDQPKVTLDKPQGFSRLIGRALAVVFLIVAGVIVFFLLNDDSSTTVRPSLGSSSGIHLR